VSARRDTFVITAAPESADTARHVAALSAREIGQHDTTRNDMSLLEETKYFKAE
jgi:hypothetical protein